MSEHSRMPPLTESDLHAYADGQLGEARRLQVEAYLATDPAKAALVAAWARDNAALRSMLDPVTKEPIPIALAGPPAARATRWRQLGAAASIAVVSASGGWLMRGAAIVAPAEGIAAPSRDRLDGMAHRAAIAHVVYSPDVRHPVEVDASQEEQLVTWLSKRLGASLKPPRLTTLGYELIGGRLLPGSEGPVAQFMYHNGQGERLTLYVSREGARSGEAAFRFASDGPVNVFYWVDGHFGYAISAGADKRELERLAQEVYRQLRAA
ncbi:MAG TPA: anti-sigma factor [Burkholderiales bacterium]|nr:anti-sigma factor [Burkholderiales bacterium]